MKKLPLEIKRNGYRYHLVRRSKNKALYCQTYRNIVIGYEVFKIRVMRARFNKVLNLDVPEQERYPCNEDFGLNAWSIVDFKDALIRYNGL